MSAAASPPESPRSEARRQAILGVANEVFLANGYSGTSMSQIATRLGGSKGTLYNYFRSKEELFVALMVATCEGPANAVLDNLPPVGGDLRADLIEIGAGLLGFILSEPTTAIHRIIVAEAGRFPELGQIFYETGPKRGEIALEAYFRDVMAAGQIRQGDPASAGRWFKDLLLANIYHKRLWNVAKAPTRAEAHAQAVEAVDIFLAAFGPR